VKIVMALCHKEWLSKISVGNHTKSSVMPQRVAFLKNNTKIFYTLLSSLSSTDRLSCGAWEARERCEFGVWVCFGFVMAGVWKWAVESK
jgi:hypothetical protein